MLVFPNLFISAVLIFFCAVAPLFAQNSLEAVNQKIIEVADTLAQDLQRNGTSDIRHCQATMQDMVTQLRCVEPSLVAARTVNQSLLARLKFKSYNVPGLLFRVGLGLLVIDFFDNQFIAQEITSHWVYSGFVEGLLNLGGPFVGLSVVLAVFLEDKFKIQLPIGLQPTETSTENLTIANIKSLFFERLKQHGFQPPVGTDREVWLTAISNRIPTDIFETVPAIEREIELLKKRVLRLQTEAAGSSDSALVDAVSRINYELETNPIFKRSFRDRFLSSKSTWLSKVTGKLVSYISILRSYEDQLKAEKRFLSLSAVLKTEGPTADRLLQSSFVQIFSDTILVERLKELDAKTGDVILVKSEEPRFEIEPQPVKSIFGILTVDVTVEIHLQGSIETAKIPLRIATLNPDKLDALRDHHAWGSQFVTIIKDSLSKHRFSEDSATCDAQLAAAKEVDPQTETSDTKLRE